MGEVKEKSSKKVEVKNELAVKKKTKEWQKPTIEDVSEKVMAQPYIRFT